MSHEPAWERRFTATSVGFPAWSDAVPDHLALITTRSGASQVWTYDLGDGSWRQVTDDPVGIEHVMVAPDGRLVWWLDATGNERGHWVSAPFDGGEPRPLVRGVPDAWSMGISMVGDRVAVGCATDDDYRVYIADGDQEARLVYRHEHPAGVGAEWPEGVGGLSQDGALLCIRHGEDGDILRSALRVLDAENGRAGRRPGRSGPTAGGGGVVTARPPARVRQRAGARSNGPGSGTWIPGSAAI